MRSISFKFRKNRQPKKQGLLYIRNTHFDKNLNNHFTFRSPFQIEKKQKIMKEIILYCCMLVAAAILSCVHSSELKIFRRVDAKTKYDLYPKIETFHPPKGYQPVRGYEPVNYRPNILNYFLNHKKKSAPPKTGNIPTFHS